MMRRFDIKGLRRPKRRKSRFDIKGLLRPKRHPRSRVPGSIHIHVLPATPSKACREAAQETPTRYSQLKKRAAAHRRACLRSQVMQGEIQCLTSYGDVLVALATDGGLWEMRPERDNRWYALPGVPNKRCWRALLDARHAAAEAEREGKKQSLPVHGATIERDLLKRAGYAWLLEDE